MASAVKNGDKITQDRVCAGTIIRDRFGDKATLDNSDDGLWDFGKGVSALPGLPSATKTALVPMRVDR